MTPEALFVKVSALEGMAHENRKAGQALLALATAKTLYKS